MLIKGTLRSRRSQPQREQGSSNVMRELFNPLQDIPPDELRLRSVIPNLYIQEGRRAGHPVIQQGIGGVGELGCSSLPKKK